MIFIKNKQRGDALQESCPLRFCKGNKVNGKVIGLFCLISPDKKTTQQVLAY